MGGLKAIEVTDLVKRYGDVLAVDKLSFTVLQGEVFGLLGPNGAGKTTTLETLVGLRRHDAGCVSVLGLELPNGVKALLPRIGVQLQSTALPRHLNAREALELFASFYPRHRSVDELLDRFGFRSGNPQRTPARYLSGGQQRRLALATAVIHDPELLFLDEPTAGLDPQARRMIWEVLAERKAKGQTTFLTTHDMYEAEKVCDRVAIVDQGKLLALGPPRQLARQSSGEHAIWLKMDGCAMPSGLEHLPGVQRTLPYEDGVLLYSDDVPRTLAELLSLGAGQRYESIHIRPPSLEDLYLKLTGRIIRE